MKVNASWPNYEIMKSPCDYQVNHQTYPSSYMYITPTNGNILYCIPHDEMHLSLPLCTPIPLDKQQKMIWNSMNNDNLTIGNHLLEYNFLGQMYKLLKLFYLPYPFWKKIYGLDFPSKIFNICYQVCCWNAIFLKQ
jgi:hypothetical protein